MARLVALGWMGGIDCGITVVYRFDLLVIVATKRVNISDVQTVLLSLFLDENELKSTIDFSEMYRERELSCS